MRYRAYQEFVAYRVINNATVQWRVSGLLHSERGLSPLLNRDGGVRATLRLRPALRASKRGLAPSEP